MPEEDFVSIEVFLSELLLFEKIERGLKEMRVGNVISEEELDKEIDSW